MQDVTTIAADRFITTLQRTKCPVFKNRYSKTNYMTPASIERINKLLRCAFKQAVRWDIVAKNPFDNTTLPKVKRKSREIWDAATIQRWMNARMADSMLLSTCHLPARCESEKSLAPDLGRHSHFRRGYLLAMLICAWEKELARVKESSLAVLGKKKSSKISSNHVFGKRQHGDRAENA